MKKINFGLIILIFAVINLLTSYAVLGFLSPNLAFHLAVTRIYMVAIIWILSLLSLIFNSENKKSFQFTIAGLLIFLLPQVLLLLGIIGLF